MIGATVALASTRRVPGGTGKTAVGRPGRRPDDRVATQVRIHDHAGRPQVTDRGDAADREAGQVVGLASGRPAQLGLAGDRRQPREVDPIGARDEAEQRLRPVVGRDDEDQRLDDLPELRADGGGRLGGGVGRLVEGGHLERDALAGGGVEDALDRGMTGGVGHGRSLASGPSCRIEAG